MGQSRHFCVAENTWVQLFGIEPRSRPASTAHRRRLQHPTGHRGIGRRHQRLSRLLHPAFVAYNAGPRRAEQWIEQYGDPRNPKVDPIDWIERIPISETRYYVRRILENMQVYRARQENNPKLSTEADVRCGG